MTLRLGVWKYRSVDAEDTGVPDDTTSDRSPGDPVVYDCTPWAGESRRLFASLLEMHGIANAWQGTVVTVWAEDRDQVDDLVEQVLSTTRPAIDRDAPTIIYEMADWPDALQNEFAAQLTISEVAYEWNADGDIVVNEADEDLVEEIIEMLPSVDSFDNVDGLEAQGLLNEAFLLCDRLAAKPADGAALANLGDIAAELESLSPPFGFEEREWRTLVDSVSDVCATDKERSHKTLAKVAGAARDRIRRYV